MSRKTLEPVLTVEEDALPPSWRLASIPDLIGDDGVFVDGDWVESKDQDPNGDVRLIQLADIGDGAYRNRSARFLTSDKSVELRCHFLKNGDVMIARMPDPLGRACIFPGDPKQSVTVVDVAFVRAGNDEFSHKWLMYFVNAPAFRSAVGSLQSGTTRQRISRKNLSRIQLPVPPRDQQDRIVGEIEKQFSRLDEAVASLKRVKANLKRYKDAVLKAAVEGKLTEEWRKQNPDVEPASKLLERILAKRRTKWEEIELAKMKAKSKEPKDDKWKEKYKEPLFPLDADLAKFTVELPPSWAWITADQLTYIVTDGEHATPKRTDDGVYLLSARNVQDGWLSLKKVDYIAEETHRKLQERLTIKPGDVLLSCSGTVGRSCVAPPDIEFSLVRSAAVLKPVLEMGHYMSYALRSLTLQDQINEKKSQTAQANIFQGKIKTLVFSLPPMAEQAEVLDQIEDSFLIISHVEKDIDAQLKRAAKCRQAILALQFGGGIHD